MKMIYRLIRCLALTAFIMLPAGPAAATTYYLHNGDNVAALTPITGSYTAAEYYGWRTWTENGVLHGGGDPLFNPQQRTGYMWLYEDPSGDLQLGIRLGDPGGGTGYYSFDFAGVPDGATTLVADEGPGYVQPGYSPDGTGFADFAWVQNGADGMIAGGLNGLEDLTITVAGSPHHPSFIRRYDEFYTQGIHGIDNWYFLTGDPLHPILIALDFNEAGKSVRISTEVPEPASMLLLASALLGARTVRRRRKDLSHTT